MQKKHIIRGAVALLTALAAVIVMFGIGGKSAQAAPVQTSTQTAVSYTSSCYGSGSWNTAIESNTTLSSDRITDFRAGRQTRCDRLVFELTGSRAVGYYAGYGRATTSAGGYVSTAGSVDFILAVRAWPRGVFTRTTSDDFHVRTGSVVYPATNPKGLWVVRQVKTAEAFEGETTYAVGLTKRTPFRLFTMRLANGHRAVVVEFKR